jgi:hypothetical protein
MTPRQELIHAEYRRFQASLRIARWAAIDDALNLDGERPLTSDERDAVDMAAATGAVPFDDGDQEDRPDDLGDLLPGACRRCGE